MPDTTEAIAVATSNTVKYVAACAGTAGAFLAGILVATALGEYGVGLSRVGWDLARAGAVVCGIVTPVALMIGWGVRQLEQQADRNCMVSRSALHEMASLRRELTLARGRAVVVKPAPFDDDVKAAVADIASYMGRR